MSHSSRTALTRFLDRVQSPLARKHRYALGFWKQKAAQEGTLGHGHYEHAFTTHFGLEQEFFRGKTMLDIGCGPRGSLEWADTAAERVGLDSLAAAYRRFGTDRHQMRYVDAPAEDMPLPDGHFDVVTSFNSLDHVDDLARACGEIIRVLAPGGLFLLITDVHDKPRIREPQTFRWEVVEQFAPPLTLLQEGRYERLSAGVYASVRAAIECDASDRSQRVGLLTAKFSKPSVR